MEETLEKAKVNIRTLKGKTWTAMPSNGREHIPRSLFFLSDSRKLQSLIWSTLRRIDKMNDKKKPWIIFAIGAAISAIVALIVKLFGRKKS